MQTTDDRLRRELEGSEASDDVFLYTVDASAIGGGIYRFAPAPVETPSGQRIAPIFGGVTYAVVPMESAGWEWSAGGEMPRPVVRFRVAHESGDVSSAVAGLLALIEALDDLVGAQVQRVKTKRRFLDDGADPDPAVHMGVEIYEVEQKSAQEPDMVEFRLAPGTDIEGAVLPAGQILNRCAFQYRVPDGQGGFVQRSCPYAGEAMFDLSGTPVTDPAADKCGKLLRDCQLRFGQTAVLPFDGFPGSGRIGVQ